MATTRVVPVRESDARRARAGDVSRTRAEPQRLGMHAYGRGKGNLSHTNFVTLLPPLLLFERNRKQRGRKEGDDAWVPPLSGYGESRSLLGWPTRGQA
jgi:hypothetical protein